MEVNKDAAPELLERLKTILSNFKSCIGGGNGEIETDKADIAKAEEAILKATNKNEYENCFSLGLFFNFFLFRLLK